MAPIAKDMHFPLLSFDEEEELITEKQIESFLLSSLGQSSIDSSSSVSKKYERQVHSACFIAPLQGQEHLERQFLGYDYTPGSFDVICAKGAAAREHTGNRRFRILIDMNLERYRKAGKSRTIKSRIVSDIVDVIRESSPEGGFVQQSGSGWYLVSDHHAREKVGQSFRDRLHSEYRSSSKAKIQRKKAAGNGRDKWALPLTTPSMTVL